MLPPEQAPFLVSPGPTAAALARRIAELARDPGPAPGSAGQPPAGRGALRLRGDVRRLPGGLPLRPGDRLTKEFSIGYQPHPGPGSRLNHMDEDDPGQVPKRGRAKQAPEVSPLLLSMFERYVRGYLARHFHAFRLAKAQRPDPVAIRGKPLIVYFNHPSWWDPLICLRLAEQFFPDRTSYAPLDAASLRKYPFFERLGFFGVELGSARGARHFLTLSQQVLSRPDAALWIAAEGRLTDPGRAPCGCAPASAISPPGCARPCSSPWRWSTRSGRSGRPRPWPVSARRFAAGEAGLTAADWTTVLETRLQTGLDALAADSLARDPARFDVLLDGVAEAGGVYDAWRRLKARLRGGGDPSDPYEAFAKHLCGSARPIRERGVTPGREGDDLGHPGASRRRGRPRPRPGRTPAGARGRGDGRRPRCAGSGLRRRGPPTPARPPSAPGRPCPASPAGADESSQAGPEVPPLDLGMMCRK